MHKLVLFLVLATAALLGGCSAIDKTGVAAGTSAAGGNALDMQYQDLLNGRDPIKTIHDNAASQFTIDSATLNSNYQTSLAQEREQMAERGMGGSGQDTSKQQSLANQLQDDLAAAKQTDIENAGTSLYNELIQDAKTQGIDNVALEMYIQDKIQTAEGQVTV